MRDGAATAAGESARRGARAGRGVGKPYLGPLAHSEARFLDPLHSCLFLPGTPYIPASLRPLPGYSLSLLRLVFFSSSDHLYFLPGTSYVPDPSSPSQPFLGRPLFLLLVLLLPTIATWTPFPLTFLPTHPP